eukprot:2045504-Pyramimonas_sp.AAC.1
MILAPKVGAIGRWCWPASAAATVAPAELHDLAAVRCPWPRSRTAANPLVVSGMPEFAPRRADPGRTDTASWTWPRAVGRAHLLPMLILVALD